MAQNSTKKSYRVTLLGSVSQPGVLSGFCSWITERGFIVINTAWLSPVGSLPSDNGCVELVVCGAYDSSLGNIGHRWTTLTEDFRVLAENLGIDIVVQHESRWQIPKRLAVFDMDSTLIKAEVIDELAIEAGVGSQVAAITEQAMRGEMDFNDSFRQRLALLEGLDESALERVFSRLEIMDGAESLMASLRTLNCMTAIISGGFLWFAERLKMKLGMDYAYANTLDILDGKVTGEVKGIIINAEQKAKRLRLLAKQNHLLPEQVIAVGDGANDLEMLAASGLGIAFRAKPLVRKNAECVISTQSLDVIPYLLGFHKDEFMPPAGGITNPPTAC